MFGHNAWSCRNVARRQSLPREGYSREEVMEQGNLGRYWRAEERKYDNRADKSSVYREWMNSDTRNSDDDFEIGFTTRIKCQKTEEREDEEQGFKKDPNVKYWHKNMKERYCDPSWSGFSMYQDTVDEESWIGQIRYVQYWYK